MPSLLCPPCWDCQRKLSAAKAKQPPVHRWEPCPAWVKLGGVCCSARWFLPKFCRYPKWEPPSLPALRKFATSEDADLQRCRQARSRDIFHPFMSCTAARTGRVFQRHEPGAVL
eukprot:scaffold86_cov338-Pavlova_lutheri.AAC.35